MRPKRELPWYSAEGVQAAPVPIVLGLLVALGTACSPGPGRPPVYPDAALDLGVDSGEADLGAPEDAGAPDADPLDGYTIVLPDGGTPETYVFTGTFFINGQTERLYAREAGGRLSLIVGGPPYVYSGTIDENGNVDVRSEAQERSGCAVARITGLYERRTAFYTLRHQGCGLTLTPFDVELRGQLVGLASEDYENSISGIYRVLVTVGSNLGCTLAAPSPLTLHYAVNVLAGGRQIVVYTAEDVLGTPDHYIGTMSPENLQFSAIMRHTMGEHLLDASMNARIERFGDADPPRLVGTQDAVDFEASCSVSMSLDGVRVSVY